MTDAEWLAAHLRSGALAELRAAVALLEQHRPASIAMRLTSDREAVVRIRTESMEGVPLAALLTQGVPSES